MTVADRIAEIRSTFDDEQNRAVNAILDDCLAGDDFVFPIVDGPPGTGKTTVGAVAVAEYLQQRDPEAQVLYLGLNYTWDKSMVNPKLRDIFDPSHPFVIVNTDGLGENEQRVFRGSVKNVAEAKFAVNLSKMFHDSFKRADGVRLSPLILSPYAAQVNEIFGKLPPVLQERCLTVYRAQGREYPCVIVSFVRKNPGKTIGFLDDLILKAQTYVACSRAQGKLVVLLSLDTFLGAGHRTFEYLCQTPKAYIVEDIK